MRIELVIQGMTCLGSSHETEKKGGVKRSERAQRAKLPSLDRSARVPV
jgi:hypothetical protein